MLASLCLYVTLFLQVKKSKNMDAQQKQQLADRLLQSNNILVTVSANPSVDQLAACIGLTLALNKMSKHTAAVFSGNVPSTIEFLQPEKTIEKTTDSLRDFIIALDKSKADKLRYKVEDKVVKIFITPYRTSISDKDLEFSQGDFNVDIVVALGVHSQADIDQAITAHGRILHDAAVSTVNVMPGGELGTLNWLNPSASSLSEMVVQLLKTMNQKVMDGQMATAFLTGIVAETQRFSNAKTQPQTMTISAELMAAGANQQLVATKLEPPKPKEAPIAKAPEPVAAAPVTKPIGPLAQASGTPAPHEGMLEIEHAESKPAISLSTIETEEEKIEPSTPQIDIDHEGTLRRLEELQAQKAEPALPPSEGGSRKILQPLSTMPPAMTGALSAPTVPPASEGLSLPKPTEADIERPSGAPPLPATDGFNTSSPSAMTPPVDPMTLSSPAPAVGSAAGATSEPAGLPTNPVSSFSGSSLPPVTAAPVSTIDPNHVINARDAVHQAISAQPIGSSPLPPIAALNALPLPLHDQPQSDAAPSGGGAVLGPAPGFPADTSQPSDPTAPPALPPPMMPPSPQ